MFTIKGCSLIRGVHYERFHCSAGQADEGLVWGIEVLLYHWAARGDMMETSFRSCGLPPSTWGSYGLVRGGHPIDAVW